MRPDGYMSSDGPAAGEGWKPFPGRPVFVLPDRRPRWAPGSRAPALLLACCAAILIALSAWSIRQELLVGHYQAKLDREVIAPPPVLSAADITVPAYAPPRVYLAQALYIAQAVGAARAMPGRAAMLSQARQYLVHVADARPHWGEYWIVKAYVEGLSTPGFGRAERDALIRSYLDAPYVHDAGRWRARRALAHWTAFPRFAQGRIAQETAWLIRTSSPSARAALLAAARGSAGYGAVLRALDRMRG